MGKNLAKAPVVGLFYSALLWLIAGILPRSAPYAQATGVFQMPAVWLLLLLVPGVLIAIAWAVSFSGAEKGGAALVVFLSLSVCGVQWIVPNLRQLLLGEVTGVMSFSDTLFQILGGCGAAILSLLLAGMLFSVGERSAGKTTVKYNVKKLGLAIRLLVLPFLFFILYYLLWYFLFWRLDAAREYYGATEKLNFMGELIGILINRGSHAATTLLVGFLYGLFSLPLLLRMPGKRILFIVSNTLLYLSGAVFYLLPSPVMPRGVRMGHLLETGVLLLVYGILSGIILHTAIGKTETAAAPAKGPMKTMKATAAAK